MIQHDARLNQARTRSELVQQREAEALRQRQQQEAERLAEFQRQRQLAFEERLLANTQKEQRRKLLIQQSEAMRRMREERYLQEYNEALEIGAIVKQQSTKMHIL